MENQAEIRHVSPVSSFRRHALNRYLVLFVERLMLIKEDDGQICQGLALKVFTCLGCNRRQRLFVEMEQMASRPFSHVFVELQVPPTFRRRTHVPYANRCQSGKIQVPSSILIEPRFSFYATIVNIESDENRWYVPKFSDVFRTSFDVWIKRLFKVLGSFSINFL